MKSIQDTNRKKSVSKRISVINGPNLNMLGTREPEIYGHHTLNDIEKLCINECKLLDFELVSFVQSNHEGELVDIIQKAKNDCDAIVINAAAYTHTSIAIHDALKIFDKPIAEVHISDPKTRESFRHISYIEPLASVIIKGKGIDGYAEAIRKLAEYINE